MCLIGNRTDTEETPHLVHLSRMIAEHQDENELNASNENPSGSGLHKREEWIKAFGELTSPKWPWRYTVSTGCQMGLVCPGRACSGIEYGGHGSPGPSDPEAASVDVEL